MTTVSLPAKSRAPGKRLVAPSHLIGLQPRRACRAPARDLACPSGSRACASRQLWSWLYVHGATDFAAMTDIAKEFRAELATKLHPRAAGDRDRAGLDRRHAQMAAAPCRRQGGRDRLHPRGGPRHALHLEPGRLHAHLQLLPYRHAEAGAQSHARRDRRPDHARARSPRRLARRDAPKTRAGCPTRRARSPMSC